MPRLPIWNGARTFAAFIPCRLPDLLLYGFPRYMSGHRDYSQISRLVGLMDRRVNEHPLVVVA